MDIALYIAELLQLHDEVSLIGTGTFYKQHVPVIYDEKTQTFMPPSKVAAFKPDVVNNTILSDYISSKKEYFVKFFWLFFTKIF